MVAAPPRRAKNFHRFALAICLRKSCPHVRALQRKHRRDLCRLSLKGCCSLAWHVCLGSVACAGDRYMDRPRHGDAYAAPPPDLAFGGRSGSGGVPPAPRSGNSFISGGQLHTVVEAGGGGAAGSGTALGGARGGTPQPQAAQPSLPSEGTGEQGAKVRATLIEPHAARLVAAQVHQSARPARAWAAPPLVVRKGGVWVPCP